MAILGGEIRLTHAEINDALDKRYDRWNESPAEQQIQDTLDTFAKIKLVRTDTAQENRQKTCDVAVRSDSRRAERRLWRSAIGARDRLKVNRIATSPAIDMIGRQRVLLKLPGSAVAGLKLTARCGLSCAATHARGR